MRLGRKSRKLWWRRPSLKWKKCAAKRYWRHSGTDDCFIRTEGCEKEREKSDSMGGRQAGSFIGAVFLALMVVFTTLQIVGRYLFSTPFPWTEEMTRYMFVWMVFISIGYAVKTGEHIRITFVRSLLRPGLRLYLDILCNILCFGFSVICMIEGYKLLSIIRQEGRPPCPCPYQCGSFILLCPWDFCWCV